MVTLAAPDKKNTFSKSVFNQAVKHLHTSGSYNPGMLVEPPFLAVIEETNRVLGNALDEGILDNSPSEEMVSKLRDDVFLFSALKTHAQLKEASELLLNPDGTVKMFSAFKQDVLSVYKTYNQDHLEVEYIFAVSSAETAAQWHQWQQDGDRYNLQLRTAGDNKVRDTHAVLNLTTLPDDDPFWNLYITPLGWRCRCRTIQVRKNKYPVSDSGEAIKKGEQATTRLDKNGNNRDEIFRFNPGKQKVIFPPKHPYYNASAIVKPVLANAKSKPKIKEDPKPKPQNSLIGQEVKTLDDLNEVMRAYDKLKPGTFARGFNSLDVTRRRNVNGQTDRRGNISLSRDRIKNVMGAMNNIRAGKQTTFDQEDSMATLWHEIVHNRNSGPPAYTKLQTARMELANEFVARKTLSQFFKDLGGELQNTEFVNNRRSTGYNSWVVKYDKLISLSKADLNNVLTEVQQHLFNSSYADQTTGLVNAISNNSKLSKSEVEKAVIMCTTDGMPVDKFEEWLKNNIIGGEN
ncbi:MAG: phage putative head morphoproteinis protein SPP1 gp7 [Bacteroidetes bacterium]|nr:MAG: phage putative head morphoproteinis protein SPP1 gp7 [Bacteroidota bacterium]